MDKREFLISDMAVYQRDGEKGRLTILKEDDHLLRRFGQVDIVEHLYQPDAAFVALACQPVHHFAVLLENFRRNLQCLGVILKLNQ